MSVQTDPELWRVIPSVPGYLASNHGRIMRTPYIAQMPHGGDRQYGGQPTRGQWAAKERRYIARLEGATFKVHRLVCEAFHGPAPADKPVCMHMDEDSRNNRPSNLRWGSQKENLNAPGFLAYCHSRTGDSSPTAKARARAA